MISSLKEVACSIIVMASRRPPETFEDISLSAASVILISSCSAIYVSRCSIANAEIRLYSNGNDLESIVSGMAGTSVVAIINIINGGGSSSNFRRA